MSSFVGLKRLPTVLATVRLAHAGTRGKGRCGDDGHTRTGYWRSQALAGGYRDGSGTSRLFAWYAIHRPRTLIVWPITTNDLGAGMDVSSSTAIQRARPDDLGLESPRHADARTVVRVLVEIDFVVVHHAASKKRRTHSGPNLPKRLGSVTNVSMLPDRMTTGPP